jgi:hypothetical protein
MKSRYLGAIIVAATLASCDGPRQETGNLRQRESLELKFVRPSAFLDWDPATEASCRSATQIAGIVAYSRKREGALRLALGAGPGEEIKASVSFTENGINKAFAQKCGLDGCDSQTDVTSELIPIGQRQAVTGSCTGTIRVTLPMEWEKE